MTNKSAASRYSFSIIIPTFNRERCIADAVRSVYSQETDDWELIIVDDASTDTTADVVRQFLDDPRVSYVRLPQNSGVNVARNRGILRAQGEWIILLDSDDELAPGALAAINEIIKETDKGMLFGGCRDEHGAITFRKDLRSGPVPYRAYLGDKVAGEYLNIIKRAYFKDITFPEDIRGGEAITWKLMAKRFGGCYISNRILRIYHTAGADRLTIKKNNYARLAAVFRKDVALLWKEYLRYYPWKLIEKIGKYLVYRVLASVT